MDRQTYQEFNRTIYRQRLANGLLVQLLPMPGFQKTYATFSTDFGSIDNHFIPYHEQDPVRVPDGVAHFLEHKMFEKADHDAFDLFGKLGADSNAYTSFTQTSYLFSTTSHLHENLDVLLDFVQDPYFTAQTVQKEQGIIGQEIKMYDDDADWRLYLGLIGNLYPHDPMRIDIAGTVDSISKITPEILMQSYRTFYQPENMNLFIVGSLDPEETLAWIEQNQDAKAFPPAETPRRLFELNDPTAHDVIPFRSLTMNIARPKVMVGLRGSNSLMMVASGCATSWQLIFCSTSYSMTRQITTCGFTTTKSWTTPSATALRCNGASTLPTSARTPTRWNALLMKLWQFWRVPISRLMPPGPGLMGSSGLNSAA